MAKRAEGTRSIKRHLPNKGNQKVTPAQVLQAYANSATLTEAARKLGIGLSTASEAMSRLKGSADYEAVIAPRVSQTRLELAAITLFNTKKVKKSLDVMPPGWEFIRSFATIVDKVKVLEPAERPVPAAAVGIKIDIRLEERKERFLRLDAIEPETDEN